MVARSCFLLRTEIDATKSAVRMDKPLPRPIIVPRSQKTWLPRVDPPLGEWITDELSGSMRHVTYTLRCHPVFEAKITVGAGGVYLLSINGESFGRGSSLEGIKQRAEREMISAMRGALPAYRAIARRYRRAKVVADPNPDTPKPQPAKPRPTYAPPPGPVCGCGAPAKWASRDHWDAFYYCDPCLPADPSIPPQREPALCNLYSMTSTQQAIRDLVRAIRDLTGNLPALPAIFPDQIAPIVRRAPDGVRELVNARWGFPQPTPREGEKPRPGYVTNVRNTRTAWWRPWLENPSHRCLVPVTSFAEYDHRTKPPTCTWFARGELRPLFFFAGIWRPWNGSRGTKAAPVEGDHLLFSFLTTAPNTVVAPIHEKAMPVLLLGEAQWETWLTRTMDDALKLQRPAPNDAVRVVMTGPKEDHGPSL
jgi:putative SOS response-associated peptidase YedK